MKFKELLISGVLFLSTTSLFAASGNSGPNWSGADFMQGEQAIFLTNGSVYYYGASNCPFLSANSNFVFSNTNLYTTNWFQLAPNNLTNANAFFGNAWGDVPSFSDANGNNASGDFAFSFQGAPTPYSTNTITIEMIPMLMMSNSPNAQTFAYPSTSSNIFYTILGQSNTVASSNGTLVTTSFAIPTIAMQGVAGWRIGYISNSTGGGQAWQYMLMGRLNGYRP